MNIIRYKTKSGETRYKFNAYLGIDPLTNKEIRTNRQGFKTIRQAKEAYIALTKDKDIASNVTFEDVYNDWIKIYKLTVKPSTFMCVGGYFKHILAKFGKARIQNISYSHVQDYAIELSRQFKKYREMMSYTSLIFKHGMRLGVINSNPCDLVEFPMNQHKEYESPAWSKEEIQKFLEYAKEELSDLWYLYFYLLITTGARRGEMLGLHWSDINGDVIEIKRTLTRSVDGVYVGTPKTAKSIRRIVIDQYAVKLLKDYKLKQASIYGFTDIVFANTKKSYTTSSQPGRQLKKVIDKYELPHMTVHGLRHSYTTLLDMYGARTKLIQNNLGHSSSKMTSHYTHSFENEQRELAQMIGNLVNNM